jgi:glutamate synthase (ferredoxin)
VNHHFALLFGYGASAINPYLVNEIIRDQVDKSFITGMTADYAIQITTKLLQRDSENMNKIGISTLHSYPFKIFKF